MKAGFRAGTLERRNGMAEETFVVFWGQRDAGNLKPLVGWKSKELKVAKIGAGTVLEKNAAAPLAEAGKFLTSEVQECKFVTVIAESAEEACLVVDRVLSQGLPNSTALATLETFGGGGPSVKPFVNSGGKAIAAKGSSFSEVAVL